MEWGTSFDFGDHNWFTLEFIRKLLSADIQVVSGISVMEGEDDIGFDVQYFGEDQPTIINTYKPNAKEIGNV